MRGDEWSDELGCDLIVMSGLPPTKQLFNATVCGPYRSRGRDTIEVGPAKRYAAHRQLELGHDGYVEFARPLILQGRSTVHEDSRLVCGAEPFMVHMYLMTGSPFTQVYSNILL